jgi:Saxitoxin biosynthesis operon protein SxtJ
MRYMIWSDIDFHPTERKLRTFAGLFFAVATTVATWQAWAHQRWLTASSLFTAGAVVAAIGLLRPMSVRSLYISMTVASFPIGWMMSHLLLAIIYFGLFTPLSVIFRLIGRDALRLRPSPDISTYFKDKPAPVKSQAYFRPF